VLFISLTLDALTNYTNHPDGISEISKCLGILRVIIAPWRSFRVIRVIRVKVNSPQIEYYPTVQVEQYLCMSAHLFIYTERGQKLCLFDVNSYASRISPIINELQHESAKYFYYFYYFYY